MKKCKKLMMILFAFMFTFAGLIIPASASRTMMAQPVIEPVILYLEQGRTATRNSQRLADVIVVEFSEIETIFDYARAWLDVGKMIYVNNPQVSAETIAEMLSIPKEGTISYNNDLLIAYSIYKVDGLYVFELHYVVIVDDVTDIFDMSSNRVNSARLHKKVVERETPLYAGYSNFYNAITRGSKAFAVVDRLDLCLSEHVVNAYAGMQRTLSQAISDVSVISPMGISPMSTTWPSRNPSRIFTATMNIHNLFGTRTGFMRGTTQVYDRGRTPVNGQSSFLYDMVTRVESFPNRDRMVAEHNVRISANISGHQFLETTTLPSGINTTRTISLSSASIGGSTSWSYNLESQLITRTAPNGNPRLVEWRARPASPRAGQSFDLTPGVTMAVTPGHAGQRGVFSTLIAGRESREFGGWF